MNAARDNQFSDTPIAVIGMACRLPGANDLDEYWSLMLEGRSAIKELPASRLDQARYYDPDIGQLGKTYSKIGGIVDERPTPTDAYRLSPNDIDNAESSHLELCHVAAEAIRNAGMDPYESDSKRGGVFVGHQRGSTLIGDLCLHDMAGQAMDCLRETAVFADMSSEEQTALIKELTNEARRKLPSRRPGGGPFLESSEAPRLISKAFGLDGPMMAINAACSSSLVALASGAYALQMGDIDVAVVGGVSNCKLDALILFSQAQSVSGTGARPFDAEADGLVTAEGYVVVLMKTLERALADKDPIRAVIRGVGVSSDGKGKSLWAPRREGQIAAIRRAYSPEVTPDSIQYIEAHATSTPVGDSTEINSLAEVFGESLSPNQTIPIGSVKANIGHTLEAAGLAGLIKTVLAMENGFIPPVINLRDRNPKVDWDKAPFDLPTSTVPWPEPQSGPRRAGVNAFGIGGLNVHVVLEQYSPPATIRIQSRDERPKEDRSIAVIGAALLAPGAQTIDAFWNLMSEGRDPKTSIPADRWNASLDHGDQAKSWVGGFLQDYQYDWKRHRVPPKQVASADPLQFMILDTVERALKDSGYEQKLDQERTAVIVANVVGGEFIAQLQVGLRLPELQESVERILRSHGIPPQRIAQTSHQLTEIVLRRMPAMLDETGSFSSSSLASRVTKTYDLLGGAFAIDSGDNSSIIAVDTARRFLLRGDCNMVICAAGQRALGPDTYEKLRLSGRLSPTGSARTLDNRSDGLAPAEGAAVLLLKRLSDAKADGDKILTVIREVGIARADDGQVAQKRAIIRALAPAKVKPEQVSAVELSASGVVDEDTEELAATRSAYAVDREQPIHLRSLAAQIGDTGGAAGMMSLVKSALSLEKLQSPVCMPAETPMEHLVHSSWCELPAKNQELPRVGPDGRVFSTLNSFADGLACHVLLERAQTVDRHDDDAAPIAESKAMPNAKLLSANSEFHTWLFESDSVADIVEAAGKLAEDADGASPRSLIKAGSPARHGLAMIYRTPEELQQKAKVFVARHSHPQRNGLFDAQGIYFVDRSPWPKVAFLFPGQGSQYAGMLKDLVKQHPIASDAAARFDAVLAALQFPTFQNLVVDEAELLGKDVWRTQLSVLLAESILLEVVRATDIQPDRISAHSFGEFAALIAAGAWDFSQAAVATFHRCRLIAESTEIDGAMMACALNRSDAQEYCNEVEGEAFVANCNSNEQTVVAGSRDAIRNLHLRLGELGVQATILKVPRPYHTPLMAPIQQPYRDCIQRARITTPRIPLLSGVDNRYVAEPETIRENLVRQFVEPVQYAEQIHRLANDGVRVLVEVGPGQVLTRMNQRIVGDDMLLIGMDNSKRSYQENLARLDAALRAAGAYSKPPEDSQSISRLDAARRFKELPPNESPQRLSPQDGPAERRQPLAQVKVRPSIAQTEATVAPPITEAGGPKPGLQILTLTGSPREMGAAHGRAMAPAIRETLDRYTKLADARIARGLPDLTQVKAMTDSLFDETAIHETSGIAEAAGVPVESLLDHNLYAHPDLGGGCTQILAPDPSSQRSLLAANEDMPLGLFLRDAVRRCIQVRKPTHGLPHLLFSTAGHVLGINGVNSAGVALTSSMLLDIPQQPETMSGFLHSIVVRRILEAATSVEAAIEALRRHPTNGGWGVCIADAVGSIPVYVECDGEQLQIKQVVGHQLVSNHAQLLPTRVEAPPHSLRRLQRLESLWKKNANKTATPATMQRWLRDQFDEGRGRDVRYPTMNTIRRVDNQLSVVFDVHRARAWATAGPNADVDENQFFELDLKQLIGLEPTRRPSQQVDTSPANSKASNAPRTRVIAGAEFAELSTSIDGQSPVDASEHTCKRFAMRCVETPTVPQADVAAAFVGGGVVLGDNQTAEALAHQLRAAGVRCLHMRQLDCLETARTTLEAFCKSATPTNLFLLTAFDEDALTSPCNETWRGRRESGLLIPYQICQRWLAELKENQLLDQGRIAAGVRLGGLFGFDDNVESAEGGFSTGLVKGLLIEQGFAANTTFRACVADFDASAQPSFVANRLIDEAAIAEGRTPEIAYRNGKRHVVAPVNQPIEQLPVTVTDGDFGKVWVVTGGARGVTAKIAQAIGERFGVKLHLIGSSPLPQIDTTWRDLNVDQMKDLRQTVIRKALEEGDVPFHAWSQVEKALEIDKNLRGFAAAGLDVTYHACDVSEHESLANLLDEIRRKDGPIEGVVHGAGFEKSAAFLNKKPEFVERTVGSKVDGAISLIELTQDDPLKYFVAFASIAGRFGGVGQTDYCVSNELLTKLVGRLRKTRPEVHAVAFDWPSWGEVGMAVRPETKIAKSFINLQYMPVADGVRHCIEELRRGCPEAEVLVTDWGRYKRFYSDEYVAALSLENTTRTAVSEYVTDDYPLIDNAQRLAADDGSGVLTSHRVNPVADTYLTQHLLRGRPIFPFVAAAEAFAEAASLLNNGLPAATIENLRIAESLRFFTDEPHEIRVRASRDGNQVRCALLSDFTNRKGVVLRRDRVHADCTVRLDATTSPGTSIQFPDVEYFPMRYPDHKLAVYHGPIYRQLEEFFYSEQASWAKIRIPDPAEFLAPRSGDRISLPCVLIDACVFSAGVHEWTMDRTAIALPRSIDRLQLLKTPVIGDRVMARVLPLESTDDYASFNIDVWDQAGRPILQIENYRANVLVATIPLDRTAGQSAEAP